MAAPYVHQATLAKGRTLEIVLRSGAVETHTFASDQEVAQRAVAITEALSWIPTPFRDVGSVKGPNGAVDCAHHTAASFRPTGLIGDFHPGKYPPAWFRHQTEERFLDCLVALGAREISSPRPGDIGVWAFGKTHAHGGVIVNASEVCHAYAKAGCVTVTPLDEPTLSRIPCFGQDLARPVKWFSLWGPEPC